MKKDSDHIQAVSNEGHSDQLPALLRQVKDNSISILMAHLENLFSTCDDLFFDLSSRANSNSEQNLYFESMREVRLKKNGVITSFKIELENGFHRLATGIRDNNQQQAIDSIDHHSLSLVQNDALEQDVAISSMVKKARSNCQESLYQMGLRFDYLVASTSVNEHNNPMDPLQICSYFSQACKLLDLNIKARIILLKQFDRIVVSKLATVYSSANNLLVEAGVLPNAQHSAKPQQNRSRASIEGQLNANIGNEVELDFTELSQIFSSLRQQSPEVLASLIPGYTSYTANQGPALANAQLLELLSGLQLTATPPVDNEQLLADSLRNVIESILASQNSEPDKSLYQPDDDVINLVAMFFDFVLDDKNLPVTVQALISRLQIPVLKVALRDKTFFSNGAHPTRKLINAIAEASIGWDDSSQPQKDRLYDLINKICIDINEQYTDSDTIFNLKLEELQSFVQQSDHKSSLVEKRTEQAAEGKAKTKLAKLMAQKVMFEKLQAASLPDTISEFLTQHWLNLLVITHLKYNDKSPEWIEAIQIIDDLLWASQRQQDSKSLQRFEKIKPRLLQRINEGLNQVTTTAEEAKETLDDIETTLDKLHGDTAGDMLIRPISAEQAKELGHTPGAGSKTWKDMTGVERQQARHKELTYEYIRKTEQLAINSWLSYTDQKTGKTIRCKLASRIEASDSYVFVNRFGFKALEKHRKDFACDMQAGRATVLDNGQLFDRAMSNVLGKLNTAKGE